VTKPNGKIGRGDLALKNVNLGGHRHLFIDVALNHEFGGNHMAVVTRNGALRAADPAKLLEATARTKIGATNSARYATNSARYGALFVSQAVLVQLAQAHAKWRRGKVSRTTSTLQACTCDFPGLASCTCQEEPALLTVLAHGALDMSQSIVTLAFALAEARIRPPAGSLHGTGPHKRGVLVIIALPHQVVYELALDSAYLRDLKQINAKCMREARYM
jgi:hypothetical protein